ncbi:MAG: P-loop NTPase fold protein [Eubacteriales bacterium]
MDQCESESQKSNTNNKGNIDHRTIICPTYLIEDSPAEEDLLSPDELGPHKRVSKAVVDLIRSDEPGGKMIGLEGSWGSGKSTVVTLLQRQLEPDNNIGILTFDAWAHEGDPLRLTYLESIITYFIKKEWVDDKTWKDKLERLKKLKRTIRINNIPNVTTFGILIALSAFLVPIGVPIIATQLSKINAVVDSTITSQGFIPWLFSLGVLFAAAPILVTFGNLLYLKCFKDKTKENDPKDWAILIGKNIEKITQDITDTPDPTSIQFESCFSELIQEALDKHEERKFVVVIDNLDRVDTKVALSNWSTLQTFLQDRGMKDKKWLKRFWIIVAYDFFGLCQLWENRNFSSDTEKRASISFIDKSLLMRFEVPPLVLSNWKKYLEDLAATAFPKHSKEDHHVICSVFSLNQSAERRPPTPRELKLYINQIGAIHRQWQDHHFPIGHIAYYIILRRNSTNIRTELINKNIPEKKFEEILPPNLKNSIAGLYFNVKSDIGQQLLLDEPINTALNENDNYRLKELVEFNPDVSWVIIEKYFCENSKDNTTESIVNKALCLERSGIFKNNRRSEAFKSIEIFGRKASVVSDWSPFDEETVDGITAIFRLIPESKIIEKVLKNIHKTIPNLVNTEEVEEIEGDGESLSPMEVVIKGIDKICNQLRELGYQNLITSPFVIPVDEEGWIDACFYFDKNKQENWLYFKPDIEFEDISQFICESVEDGSFSEEYLTAIKVTNESAIDCNWEPLVSELGQRLNAENNVTAEELKFLLNGFSYLRRYSTDIVQSVSNRLSDEGHLMHRFHQIHSQQDINCIAQLICVILEQNPEVKAPPNIGNSNDGYNELLKTLESDDSKLAKNIVDILNMDNNLELLLLVLDKRDVYDSLIIRCLRLVAEGDTPEKLFSSESLVKYWILLKDILDENDSPNRIKSLIKHICANKNLAKEIQKSENTFSIDNASLYSTVLECSSPKALSPFIKWCVNGLENLDYEEWKEDILGESDSLGLLLKLINTGVDIELKQPYMDALVEHAKSIINEKNSVASNLITQWPDILNVLGSGDLRKTFRREILRLAMDKNGNISADFFKLYGEEINNAEILKEENLVIHKLFTPLIRKKKVKGLSWLKKVFSNNPKLLDGHPDTASLRDFRERILNETEKKTESNAHNLMVDIANILRIKK